MIWRLFFTLGSQSLFYLQFLRLVTFSFARRFEGKDVSAAYQPVISVAVCSGHHSGVHFVSRVMLLSWIVVQEVPMFGAWVSPCCLEPILLLEQCVDDDELTFRTEFQKQLPVIIAVANSVST